MTVNNKTIIAGMILCIIGVVLVIGTDFSKLIQGKVIGYLLALGAVFCWTTYNYITSYLKKYDSLPPVSYTHLDVYKRQVQRVHRSQMRRCVQAGSYSL